MIRERWSGTIGCDRAALSAYRDGELTAFERRSVERHVDHCPSCRSVLEQYAAFGAAIEETVPAPAALTPALVARLHSRATRGAGSARGRRAVVFGAAAMIMVALAVLVLPSLVPGEGLPVAAAYPAPQATGVPVQAAITVQFTRPVDRPAVASAVRIDPAVPVEPAWEGNTLLLKPKEPLQPGTQYTVTIETPGSGGRSQPVLITTFRTDVPSGAAQPTRTSTKVATVVTTPTAPEPTAVEPPCETMPVRGFRKVYAENPGVRRAIGCAIERERALQMAEQSFQNGHMLWRGDTRTIYVLGSDGRWSSLPDNWQEGIPLARVEAPPGGHYAPERGFGKIWRETPGVREELGWAMAPERGFGGAVQGYQRGLMFWSDARWITVLYSNGTWERFPDTFGEPAPTPTAGAMIAPVPTPPGTPSPGAFVTPTTTIASAVTASPTATATCTVAVVRGFGKLYDTQPLVRQRLGCPSAIEQGIAAAEEDFQGGTMYWRGDVARVYVLFSDGNWVSYPDTFRESDPVIGGETAPSGLFEPVRGFGKVWRGTPLVRTKLGWAVERERGQQAAMQDFAGGLMLWSDRKRVYVLYDDGTWEWYQDTFEGEEALGRKGTEQE